MLTRAAIQKIVVTAVIAIIAAALLFVVYRGWQAYLSGPSLSVSQPADYSAFSTSTVTIAGTAARIQNITVDGEPITIDDTGDWSQTVLLSPGYNIETVAAVDRFGHAVSRRIELVYLAPTASSTAATSTEAATTTAAGE